jgi:hypothetical protein
MAELLQVVAHRQSGLPPAHDDRVEPFVGAHRAAPVGVRADLLGEPEAGAVLHIRAATGSRATTPATPPR